MLVQFLYYFCFPAFKSTSVRHSATTMDNTLGDKIPLKWDFPSQCAIFFCAKGFKVCLTLFLTQGTKAGLSALLVPLPIIGLGWLVASPEVNVQLQILEDIDLQRCQCFPYSSIMFLSYVVVNNIWSFNNCYIPRTRMINQGWLKSTRNSYLNTGSFPRNHI